MKKIICFVLAILCVLPLGSCTANSSEVEDKTNNTQTKNNEDGTVINDLQSALFDSYEDILNDYSQKLRDATPTLIEEYKKEAANNQNGLSGLAKLCNDKVSELAKISTEGIQKMAKLMYKSGNGSYSEYSDWAEKLQDVYTEEAGKIQQAYMDSAT